MHRFEFVIAAVVAVWLTSASHAHAQAVQIEITGLPPGASVEVALAAANLNKTEPIGASTGGSASGVLDFANLGKAEPLQRESLQVYILDCNDPSRVVRLVFVAEGGQAPRDCDEKQQDVDKGCRCRRVAVPIFLTSSTKRITIDVAAGTAQVFEGAPAATMGRPRTLQLLVGVGADQNNNTSARGPQTPSGFTRTSSELKEKGWDGTFFTELYFVPWLGAGYAFQAGSKVTFDERITFTANPRFALTIDAAFDPTMHHVFGTVRFPPRSRVQVFVQPGATIWKASSITVQQALDGTTVLEERRIDLDREGVSPYVAGGVDWSLTRHVGTRVKYSYARLKDSGNRDDDRGADEKYHTIGIFLVVNPWPVR